MVPSSAHNIGKSIGQSGLARVENKVEGGFVHHKRVPVGPRNYTRVRICRTEQRRYVEGETGRGGVAAAREDVWDGVPGENASRFTWHT